MHYKTQSVLATEITSTCLTQKSHSKTVINDIYWHIVKVCTMYAPQLYMLRSVPPLARHMEVIHSHVLSAVI